MTLRLPATRPCLALAALLLAGGCGMYGDLYLEEPEAPPRPQVEEVEPIAGDAEAAAEQPAPEDEDKPKPQQPPPEGAATRYP
jgi:hypothetical protein